MGFSAFVLNSIEIRTFSGFIYKIEVHYCEVSLSSDAEASTLLKTKIAYSNCQVHLF